MARRHRKDYQKLLGTWKFVDDRSGFADRSTHAVVDHRGRITTQENWDPVPVTELIPAPIPPEKAPPVIRAPETNYNFISVSYPSYEPDINWQWEFITINWEDIDTNWEEMVN